MYKSVLTVTTTAIMVLLLVTACTEDDKEAVTVEKAEAPVIEKPVVQAEAPKETAKPAGQSAPIMNQPVDFSTPEALSKTLQDIREQAGSRAVRQIESTMGHMMTYDLGVARDEAKMLKKLNGKTPNQIIAMGTARR